MLSRRTHGRIAFTGLLVLVSIVIVGILFWNESPSYDETLTNTLARVAEIHAYAQHVETTAQIADRTLHIEGDYQVNGAENQFSSRATTTLIIPLERGRAEIHQFTLQNISLGNDVYTKVETDSPVLRTSIPHSPEWQHFNANDIPLSYANISTAGPTLDNLLLFAKNGAYLTLKNTDSNALWEKEPLARYSFILSDNAPKNSGGTLGTLFNRIGNGSVDIWIDSAKSEIRHIVIIGENYLSTTTISAINNLPPIELPMIPTPATL